MFCVSSRIRWRDSNSCSGFVINKTSLQTILKMQTCWCLKYRHRYSGQSLEVKRSPLVFFFAGLTSSWLTLVSSQGVWVLSSGAWPRRPKLVQVRLSPFLDNLCPFLGAQVGFLGDSRSLASVQAFQKLISAFWLNRYKMFKLSSAILHECVPI